MAPLHLSTGQTSNNRVVLRKHAADEAEERRLAGLQPGDRRQPDTGGPDERQPDLLQRVAQAVGRPRVVADELRPSLGADALRAGRAPADEPAHPHPEPDRRAASREVGAFASSSAIFRRAIAHILAVRPKARNPYSAECVEG